MGLGSVRKNPDFRARPQIWLLLQNRKYFPSAVQVPQHSCGRSGRSGCMRCKPVPSTDTSQSCAWSKLSYTLKLRRLPSGDQFGHLTPTWSLMETTLRGSLPSALETNKLSPEP